MAEIKIEKDVPVPGHREKYPFGDMLVGDSFVTAATSIRQSANAFVKKYGGKFTIRKIEGGFRCWRIE